MQEGTNISQVLEEIQHPSPEAQKLRKTWENKELTEQVPAGRKLLYDCVSPAVEEIYGHDAVEQVEAFFETLFAKAEQKSMTRGRSLSGSSS